VPRAMTSYQASPVNVSAGLLRQDFHVMSLLLLCGLSSGMPSGMGDARNRTTRATRSPGRHRPARRALLDTIMAPFAADVRKSRNAEARQRTPRLVSSSGGIARRTAE
jgi:hypothetical protein